jgi:galactokinase/mevalonate kinase-like predicted kinase
MKSRTRSTGISLAEQDFTRGDTPRFDLVILTAANPVQAAGYRAQLARRKVDDDSGWDLPCARKALVVADPKDKRAGSGIATFIALYEAAKYFAELTPKARTLRDLFAARRILILHSGGDSRRLPAYAAIGKIFVPLPVEDVHGDPRTVFDLVLEDFAALEPGDPATPNLGSITIAAGDVMLNLAKTGINLHPVPDHVVGVTARASIETGSRHGVFVTNVAKKSGDARVRTFLQKPTEAQARAAGAIGKDNTVAIDTGVVIFDSTTAASWLQSLGASITTAKTKIKVRTASIRATGTLASMCRATSGSIDLYEHILPTLAGNTAALAKLTPKIAASLSKALAPTTNHFLARHAPAATFYHIGSTMELLHIGTATVFDVTQGTVPRIEPASTVVGSEVGPFTADGPVWIEGCRWGDSDSPVARFGGLNVITGWPKEAGIPEVVSHFCITWLPIGRSNWARIIYTPMDDWKKQYDSAAPTDEDETYVRWRREGPLNCTIAHCLQFGIWKPEALWNSADRCLYTARLWRVGSIKELDYPTSYDDLFVLHRSESVLQMKGWYSRREANKLRAHRRRTLRNLGPTSKHRCYSMHELVSMVNHARLNDAITAAREWTLSTWQPVRIMSKKRIDLHREARCRFRVTPWGTDPNNAPHLVHKRSTLANLRSARIRELQLPLHPFNEFEELFRKDLPDPHRFHLGQALTKNQVDLSESRPINRKVVATSTPIRIDLAGGWTDTPPICQTHGGTVINLAATLDDVNPISVQAAHSDKPGIHIRGIIDGEQHSCTISTRTIKEWSTWKPLKGVPAWAKLVPSAVSFTKLVESLDTGKAGVSLSFSSSVPKGSGLGTSSILSAALCAACYALQGKYSSDLLTKHAIAAATLCVEHAIGSGGGWQDQYGALFPGLKSLSTSAGNIQHAECTPLTIGPRLTDMFASRTLLYFTGQQRLAANILQNFVNRYLDGDAPTWRTLDRLRKNVLDVREAIDRDDPAAFARHITMYWLLKRSIDPSTTNAGLNRLVARVTPHLDGYLFPGAGGGGFLFMIARTTASAKALRHDITSRPPAPTARFYDWSISHTPLTVTMS